MECLGTPVDSSLSSWSWSLRGPCSLTSGSDRSDVGRVGAVRWPGQGGEGQEGSGPDTPHKLHLFHENNHMNVHWIYPTWASVDDDGSVAGLVPK